jgi:hypothetical protein
MVLLCFVFMVKKKEEKEVYTGFGLAHLLGAAQLALGR